MERGTSILSKIKRDPKLKRYFPISFQFNEYLRSTKNSSFLFQGIKIEDLDFVEINQEVEYIHRWTRPYRRGWMAKLYLLEEWQKLNQSPITMLTFTTYQGVSSARNSGEYSIKKKGHVVEIPESFEMLKTGFKKAKDLMRCDLGSFDYLSVMEPHQTGYPHLHVPIFREIPESYQDKIKRIWEQKYKYGSKEHGINFSLGETHTDIKSMRNYLAKYLSKGFLETGSRFGEAGLSPGEFVFHAHVWKHKYRIFGASQALSQVMRYQPGQNPVEWLTTDLIDEDGIARRLWQRLDLTREQIDAFTWRPGIPDEGV